LSDRAIEELAFVDFLLRFDAGHSLETKPGMHQSEVFEKGTAEPDVLVIFKRERGSQPHQQRQEQFPVDGFVGPQPVRK